MSGIEMIRKDKQHQLDTLDAAAAGGDDPAYGVTMPLLTTAAGEKFGKSMGNAVWLDPTMTSPFEFYQFFLRTTDEEVLKYLKIFTFIRVVEMKGIMEEHNVSPRLRVWSRVERNADMLASGLAGDAVGPGGAKDPRGRGDRAHPRQ